MSKRIVVVSNRLPIILSRDSKGKWQTKPSSGGLVNALTPIIKERKGMWIGWLGISGKADIEELLARASEEFGYTLEPVSLTAEEYNKYYLGFSNQILWPLFHDLQSRCNFDPAFWNAYETVNRKFAQSIAENTTDNDYIWIHDYHLMLAGREFRLLKPGRRIGFFLHTPFPPLDIYMKLPWRLQVLKGLLEYDLLGFQTIRDRNNFLNCTEALIKGLRFDARRQISRIKMHGRAVRVGVFPISINYNEFAREASSTKTITRAEQLRKGTNDCKIILGADRLDYSKGIPERLKAFRNTLERYHDLHGKITLVQIVVPSRENIPEYQKLKTEIETLVSEINGQFGYPGWLPVNYMFRSMARDELVAYYTAADIALITPLKDGMNLVAKEFCAANINENAALILSEFAGAAQQLRKNAIVVNPYDTEGTAAAIHTAYLMPEDERKARMNKLRQSIRKRDIYWWLGHFLKAAAAEPVIKPQRRPRYTVPAGQAPS
jgi:alpha,alpha-trehalose-phosphate synthase [UDP-forming]